MVKISILIPVYNAKDFLYDSIPSILNQTFTDIELICVNDGSKDNSLEILNEFASKDDRVKVIDKENGGCGSARNMALEHAAGEYIYFFDPDDRLELNALELAYNKAVENNSDMVIFKADIFDKNGVSKENTFFYYNKTLNKEQYDNLTFEGLKEYVLRGGYAPWSKLYSKSFLDSYDDFKFNVGLAFDDVPFHVKSIIRAKNVSFINEFLYHYRVDNVNSVNSTSSNGFDIFTIIDIVEEILINENYFNKLEKEFYKFKVHHILLYIISTDSEKYYEIAREKFSQIDKKYFEDKKYLTERFDLVLSVEDFEEFKHKYNVLVLKHDIKVTKRKIKRLNKENKELKKENKKLNKLNNEILNSNTWKITNYLRKIKK